MSLFAGIAALSAQAAEPRPFEAVYELTSGATTVGEMRLTLELQNAQRYRYTAASRATGLLGRLLGGEIVESSEGTLAAHQVRPDKYAYRRKGRKAREVLLDFDWGKAQVVNTVNDDPWVMHVPPGALDKLAVQLALMLDLDRGRQRMDYSIADGGTLKAYRFETAGRETIETPLGAIETIRVRRDRGDAGRYTELWCAPQWGYLPIQVVQFRNGKEHARMRLRSLTARE